MASKTLLHPTIFLESIDSSLYCPPEYFFHRGQCYRYHLWFWRHADHEKYKYLETWKSASEECRKDGARMLSLKDQDEADFIQVHQLYLCVHGYPAVQSIENKF